MRAGSAELSASLRAPARKNSAGEPASRLAASRFAMILRIEHAGRADARGWRRRARYSDRPYRRGSWRGSGRCRTTSPSVVPRSRAWARPSTSGRRRRPAPSGRRVGLGAVRIGDLAVGGERRRHRDVEVGEIGIVVEVRPGDFRGSLAGGFWKPVSERIDIGRAALARLGDQRQVGRQRIVVGLRAPRSRWRRAPGNGRPASPCGWPARRSPG